MSIGVAAIMLETIIDPISLINDKNSRSNCSYISFGIIKVEQNALPLLYICNIYKILANLHFQQNSKISQANHFGYIEIVPPILRRNKILRMRVQYHGRHGIVPPTSASIQVLCEVEVLIELFSSKNLSDGVYTNKETNNLIVTNIGEVRFEPWFL